MISDEVEKIIEKAFEKDKECVYEYTENIYEDLISLGELIDRLTICNYKLYRLKDDVMKETATKDFKAWAANQDVKLVLERSRLKKCIDQKVISMIDAYKNNKEKSFFNPETKNYNNES